MMRERLERIFAQGFRELQPRLLERIEASLAPVEDWLRAEQEAERQTPPLPDPHLDEVVLSGILRGVRERGRLSDAERERLDLVRARVGAFRARIRSSASRPRLVQGGEDLARVRRAFEAHYGPYCELLRDLRILDLELAGGYDPPVHDPLMEAFSWKDLTDRELALVPPLVVLLDAERTVAETATLALGLFGASLPVKLVALQHHIGSEPAESGRAMAYQLHPDLGCIGISLRSVYVLQATEGIGESFDQEILAALRSPRPALLSLWEGPRDDPEASRLALASRAFPYLRYDPDQGFDCLSCLSIDRNPEVDEPWVREVLPLPGGGEEEQPVTFAGFAWRDAGLKAQFELLPEAGLESPSLAEYLEMESAERHHLRPFLLVREEGETLALAPSNAILFRCQDHLRLWRYLQGLAGIRNPSVEQAAEAPGGEQRAREPARQEDVERRIAAERETAVAQAMQILAEKLLGLEEMGVEAGGEEIALDLAALTGQAAADEIPLPASAATEGATDEPWIETKLCTACDECTRINKRIFAYNKDKQAVIKNPRGGPFRDLVKAAEKCSAGAIHPGKPHDPTEKDLAKWVKRAEKYQ